jgi:hypothetical protein
MQRYVHEHAVKTQRMHLTVCRELDLKGKRLPVDSRPARRNAAACIQERLRCVAEDGSHAASARTFQVKAVVAVGRRVGPHEREAAFQRVGVAVFAFRVVEAAAPQNEKPRFPLLEKT